MKRNNFTMIELLTVIVMMSILMALSFNVLKPDRAAGAIKQVGGNIDVWNAKAMSEATNYRLEFTKNKLEVYHIYDDITIAPKLVHTENIIWDLTFTDGKATQIIEFNSRGEMVDLLGASIYSDKWLAQVNGFTGHLSYTDLTNRLPQ